MIIGKTSITMGQILKNEKEINMEKYIQHCLEGDVLSAYHFLKELQSKTDEQLELIKKYEETFFKQNPTYSIDSNDPWVRGVVSVSYRYQRKT